MFKSKVFICLLSVLFFGSPASAFPHNERFKVIGGGFANPSSNSVALLRTPQGNLCSGAVVSSTAILTAAHCSFIGSRRGATATIRGKKYSLASGRRAPSGLDVGIIKVKGKITAPRYQVPSGLRPQIGQRFLLYGFGNPYPGRLTFGYMFVSFWINNFNEFIANPINGANACPGDSGGPALVRYKSRDTIIGVVSRGPAGCRSGNQVVFPLTTTASMARWIRLNS